jgi:integrase
MAWVERCGKDSWRVRYRRDDDTIGAIPGFPTRKAAQDHADTMESEQRQGTWLDPHGGKTLLREWTADWLDAQDIAVRTEDYYRSLLDNHIHPRWGDTPLGDITGLKVAGWAKKLRNDGYADSTVTGITKLLSLLLADAAEARLIPANPIRARRRGRRHRHSPRTERIWATPEQALAVADNAARLPAGGPSDAVMIVLAAWTGARWGEITGLQRHNTFVEDDDNNGSIKIAPRVGALIESSHGLELGPPKTPESARRISLPPSLTRLLRAHLASHDHPHVFLSARGEWHRRSNFARRVLRPAADGTQHQARPAVALSPAKPGLTFHGLRHGHKTWMIADQIPEVAQSRRLGHLLEDKIQETYSHVAVEVETRLLQALEDRWNKAVANSPDNPAWRTAAST